MTEAELAVLNSLTDGELSPLADLLADQTGELHPLIARYLVSLIRGTSQETDYRLVAKTHPDLARREQGAHHQRLKSVRSLVLARVMVRNGVLNEGQFEAALTATMASEGVGRSTVMNAWSDKKQFVQAMIAHGIMKIDEPGES